MSAPDDISKEDPKVLEEVLVPATLSDDSSGPVSYRLYKRRFAGLVGMIILNAVGGMGWPWFGPISNNMAAEFHITLDQVNWLGNIVACIYLPVAFLIPPFVARYGIRRACDVGAASLLIAAWVRYAGTPKSLPLNGSYALLILGQFFAAITQPIFQVLGPKYSETWFDLKGRTTATMLISIANPVGGALGQLLSPIVGDTRQSILVLAIISSVAAPTVFLITSAPPTPPTYAGSHPSGSFKSLLRAWIKGEDAVDDPHQGKMSGRQRLDFLIVTWVFGVLIGTTNTFSILTGQILQPHGYSTDTAGFMGATLLLSGIVAAIATAPLFDRVFTHHLALASKILVPMLGIAWLSLIWAVKAHNTAGLYSIMALLGIGSITMLPIALELACDLTRNADGSSSICWFIGNLFCVIFVLVQNELREGPDASPPLNMRRALIFNGVFVFVSCCFVFFLEGKQTRKEIDEQKLDESLRGPGTRT